MVRETGIPDRLLEDMSPWLYGKKCPLEALTKILDRYNETGDLAPSDYFNMMIILSKFCPEVAVAAAMVESRLAPGARLPIGDPDINVLRGFDD